MSKTGRNKTYTVNEVLSVVLDSDSNEDSTSSSDENPESEDEFINDPNNETRNVRSPSEHDDIARLSYANLLDQMARRHSF